MKECCCCQDQIDPEIDEGRDCERCGNYVCSECDIPELPCVCTSCGDPALKTAEPDDDVDEVSDDMIAAIGDFDEEDEG